MEENSLLKHYAKIDPDEAYSPRRFCKSVHYKNADRFDLAKKQASFLPVDKSLVAKYVLEFLQAVGIETTDNPIYNLDSSPESIDYKAIKEEFGLKDERDIVWIKFTEDGYVGVVAVSNDINFDMPDSADSYNDKIDVKGKRKWKYNTSGIITHSLNKRWDTSFVLLFPLKNIPGAFKRHDVEKAIGNYLLEEKKAPILDAYSHLY